MILSYIEHSGFQSHRWRVLFCNLVRMVGVKGRGDSQIAENVSIQDKAKRNILHLDVVFTRLPELY
jgi:hypothetical protein